MRFVTIATPRSGTYTHRVQTGGRGEYFRFEYELRPDPTAERLRLRFGERLAGTVWPEILPAITAGVDGGLLDAAGVRHCCTDLLVSSGFHHEIQNPYPGVLKALRAFVRDALPEWTTAVEPLRAEWLTSDVVALARGVHATAALDGLPALTDALLEAGCDHPLVMEHLRTCPDHAPSCWVVEMILDQAAAREAGTSG